MALSLILSFQRVSKWKTVMDQTQERRKIKRGTKENAPSYKR
jgi:hypothetical protein